MCDSTMEGGESDNISFNGSLVSTYSAEEEIIQQRGRKSPKKQSIIDQHQLQQQLPQHINTREIFLKIKQSSMQSPEKLPYNDTLTANGNSSNATVVNNNNSCKRNLNKSLLRTPIKRRLKLRRHSSGAVRKVRRRC